MECNDTEQVSTIFLKTAIEEAQERILPLFEVTPEELTRFRKPGIRRTLKADEYPEHDRKIPAYSSIDNFLFFPLKNPFFNRKYESIFSQTMIQHEVSHYIHHEINPSITNKVREYLLKKKCPPGVHQLMEIVAEYPNFILGGRDYSKYPYSLTYKNGLEIFKIFGKEFLSELARMSLEEAIHEKIIRTQLD